MRNNRLKKNSLGIFSLAFLSLGLGIGCLSGARPVRSASAVGDNPEGMIDPEKYEALSNASFLASIRDCTGTSLSRRYSIEFESLAITAFKSRYDEVYSVVDDPNYSMDKQNPYVDPDTPAGTPLNGYIYTAKSVSGRKTLYFPNFHKYGSFLTIKNTKIVSNCMVGGAQYNGLEAIYICDGYEVVEANAFTNVPENVIIQVAAPSKPEGWADNWTDAPATQIQWGVETAASNKETRSGGTENFGEGKDYILGYKGDENIGAHPMYFKYDLVHKNGTIEKGKTQMIPTKHKTNPYDAVGTYIGALTSSFTVSIDLEKGESIVENSVEIYNIFEAIRHYTDTVSVWPSERFQEIYDTYTLAEYPFPVLEGDYFSHQLFEVDPDKYITITADFDTNDEAQELVNQYTAKLDAMVDEEDQKVFALDDTEFPVVNYGNVYKREIITEANEHYAMFVQLYVHNHHFISYFVIDHMVQKFDEHDQPVVDEDGNPVYEYSRELPITNKKSAIRPYRWEPDIDETAETGFYKAVGSKRYSQITYIDNLFDLNYKSSSKFMGYTAVGMNANKKLVTVYGAHPVKYGVVDPSVNLALLYNKEDGKYYNGNVAYKESELEFIGTFEAPELYITNKNTRTKVETNLANVISGQVFFRYVLKDLNSAKLIVRYRSGGLILRKDIKIVSPNPAVELSGNNNVLSFLVNSRDVDGVSSSDILAVGLADATLNVHLFNSDTNSIIRNTDMIKVFGNIEVLPYSSNELSAFNINLYLILFAVILTGVYGLLALALFFYQKNKFKNDEFRRVKPKQFLKTALASYLGVMLLALAINFIVLRFAVFKSSIPVSNPIDPFVIGFGVAGAISIGLFIRMFVIIAKQNKTVKQAKRLHLDRDVVDDGTK